MKEEQDDIWALFEDDALDPSPPSTARTSLDSDHLKRGASGASPLEISPASTRATAASCSSTPNKPSATSSASTEAQHKDGRAIACSSSSAARPAPRAIDHPQLAWVRNLWPPESRIASCGPAYLLLEGVKSLIEALRWQSGRTPGGCASARDTGGEGDAASLLVQQVITAFESPELLAVQDKVLDSSTVSAGEQLETLAHNLEKWLVGDLMLEGVAEGGTCSFKGERGADDNIKIIEFLSAKFCLISEKAKQRGDRSEAIAALHCLGLALQLALQTAQNLEDFEEVGPPEQDENPSGDRGQPDPEPRTGDGLAARWLALFEMVAYGEGLGLVARMNARRPASCGKRAKDHWLGLLLVAAEKAVAGRRRNRSSSGSSRRSAFSLSASFGAAPSLSLKEEAMLRKDLALPSSLPQEVVGLVHVPRIDPTKKIETRVHGKTISPFDFAREFRSKPGREGTPVVIRGATKEFGCDVLGQNLRELLAISGDRLCPVSYGSALLGSSSALRTGITTIGELILEHLAESNRTQRDFCQDGAADLASCSSPPRQQPHVHPEPDVERFLKTTAYMSQHQLFHQLPDFLLGHPADSDSTRSNAGDPEQNDVDCTSELRIPSYNLGRRLQPPNAWIGTRGTVTTLHSDTSDGFLCQVAGYKYVRLYGALDRSPGGRDETHLYAQLFREGEKWFGTSPVRIEIPDFDKHPNFAAVADQYTEALLEPGDMLYIPEGHWHYIRSLTTSVSINFW